MPFTSQHATHGLLLAVSAAVFGCSAQLPTLPVASVASSAAPTWQLQLSYSGGFAGLAHEYQLSGSDATLVAIDHKRNLRASRPLTSVELAEIDALVAAAPSSDAERYSASCADCYQYELRSVRDGAKHVSRYDSLTLAGSGHEALLSKIVNLGQALLKRP